MWHFQRPVSEPERRSCWRPWQWGGDPGPDETAGSYAAIQLRRQLCIYRMYRWSEPGMPGTGKLCGRYIHRSVTDRRQQWILWGKSRVRKRYGNRFYPFKRSYSRMCGKQKRDLQWRRRKNRFLWQCIIRKRLQESGGICKILRCFWDPCTDPY